MQINNLDNQISFNTSKKELKIVEPKVEPKIEHDDLKSIKDEDLEIKGKESYTKEDIIHAIEDANEEFIVYDRRFEFSIHEKTKQITVKIFDTLTDEVIREVPPEKILDTIAGIWEVAGLLVDEKI